MRFVAIMYERWVWGESVDWGWWWMLSEVWEFLSFGLMLKGGKEGVCSLRCLGRHVQSMFLENMQGVGLSSFIVSLCLH